MSTYKKFMIILTAALLIVAILNIKNKSENPQTVSHFCHLRTGKAFEESFTFPYTHCRHQ